MYFREKLGKNFEKSFFSSEIYENKKKLQKFKRTNLLKNKT